MFVKHFVDENIALFIVYVEDIIITGDDLEQTNHLKNLLAKEFEVKDLGQLKCFLGIEMFGQRMVFLFFKGSTLWIYFKKPGCLDAKQPNSHRTSQKE